MHQDIKTFSEALDIETPLMDVTVSFKFHGQVKGFVELNGMPCPEGTSHHKVGLLDPIKLISDISEFTEGISAIEITELTINGYNVIPKYQMYADEKRAYHDWYGRWKIQIPAPFYAWYHTISGQGMIA